jgi:SAM-dependent methyltransferase
MQNALRLIPGEGGKWLEVGCGPGVFLVNMSEDRSRLCLGVDIDAKILPDAAVLTKFHLGTSCVVRASAYALPFPGEFFDGLVALETVEHLSVVRFLKEASRVLKPNACLIFSVPIEIGSALLARQTARAILGVRCENFAPMKYSGLDFAKMVLKIGDRQLYRRWHKTSPISDHMFFSFRGFLEDLDLYFAIDTLEWFPLPFPGPWAFNLQGRAIRR